MGDNKEHYAYFSPEWRMGSCFGPRTTYSPNVTYYDRCCLSSGTYTLICTNSKSKYGWGNADFKLGGKRYCDDFVGFKGMRTVSIQGINRNLDSICCFKKKSWNYNFSIYTINHLIGTTTLFLANSSAIPTKTNVIDTGI